MFMVNTYKGIHKCSVWSVDGPCRSVCVDGPQFTDLCHKSHKLVVQITGMLF